ncbi:Deoxyribonuclease-2-alpha, partial [Trichinella murrelli]
MFIFYVIALYTLQFIVYKLPGGKSSHHLLQNAATDWSAVETIDDQQKSMHSTMNIYIASGTKQNTNIVVYSNYPPHFKFELPMSPEKALAITDLFSNEKITKEAAAFLCMSYSDVNLRAIAKIIDYEQPIAIMKSATVQAFYDSSEVQKLVNGLHKYQPTTSASGDGIATLTPPGTVKIFASAPVGYSSDIYLNYIVKIMKKSFQVYTPGTTTTVLRRSCVGTLKVENVLGPITVKDTEIPIGQDGARWSVPKSDPDFVCLSNTGRTANDAKYGATVACVLSKEAAAFSIYLAVAFFVYKLPGGKSSHYLKPGDADWEALADIDAAQQPIHSTMNTYFNSGNKDNANIILYSNYPPHFKFELPMSPGKGVIMAEDANKGFWLVHTAKYFPNLAGAIGDLFSNEKTKKDAAAFLCMTYSDVNLRAIAKIIDYEQPIVFFAQRSAAQATQAFYDSSEIQTLVNGLHKYQPTASTSGDGITTFTPPGPVKIFASAPVAYSSDIYSNYVVKILQKSFQVYTPGTTATVLKKSCVGTLKVENVLGPITVKDTEIPIGQDSARWSVPKSDSDFICLSNTGRTANDAKYGATVACVLSKEAATLFRNMIKKENLDACPFFVYKLPGGKSSHYLKPGEADWAALADIDAQQQPIHSTMDKYFASGNKDHANIVAYSNYPPHFKFELPMSPGKGVIMAETANKGFWLVHTAKYFPNLAGTTATLFSNEKTTKDAAAFLCMSYSDVNLRAIAKIIDYEQPIIYFTQRSASQPVQSFYDSPEIQKLVNGLQKYQPIAATSGDGVRTLTQPGTVKIFASAPVAYSSDIYSNYVVKILKKSLQVYTPGTTTTVLRKLCVGSLKVENVLGPITVKDTKIPIKQDSARWSVPKSDPDFVCLSNTGRTV